MQSILRSFSPGSTSGGGPALGTELTDEFTGAGIPEIEAAANNASRAFPVYSQTTQEERALFLEAIGEEIMLLGDVLINRAMLETGLPEARLIGERARTVGQLQLFAGILREGSWVEAVIDPALPDRKPLPRADIRKMLVPVGPVLVFGASNFPFAFSTAGGDTASALAAGNPVIVKAHEGHLGTNELVGKAIQDAAKRTGMPTGVFSYLVIDKIANTQELIKNELIKAIGFTGSYKAGMSIFHTATTARRTPIPVYAEMSSVNPVVILPEILQQKAEALAAQIAASITLGSGQFCTNPGLVFLMTSGDATRFEKELTNLISNSSPTLMLNKTVCNNYYNSKKALAGQNGISILAEASDLSTELKSAPALLKTTATDFIRNAALQAEVFGPSSLIVWCKDRNELLSALESLHGQLTGTVMGTATDLAAYNEIITCLNSKAGRVLFNGVPTGVEVCHAMVHGGPFPATTDVRSTSVGGDAIKRFVRPLCLQDCPSNLLPPALQNENPLNLMRKINGQFTTDKINL